MVEKMVVANSGMTVSVAACYHISEPGGGMGCKKVPRLLQCRCHLCLA